jgi:hypothetical protein
MAECSYCGTEHPAEEIQWDPMRDDVGVCADCLSGGPCPDRAYDAMRADQHMEARV